MRGRKAELRAIDGGLKGVPAVPATIPTDFADEWTAISREMVQRKILTTPGLGLVETYIVARWTVREAQKALQEHGVLTKSAHGMFKPNPAAGVLSKSLEAVARLSAELGITPAARAKAGFQRGGQPSGKGAPAGLDI